MDRPMPNAETIEAAAKIAAELRLLLATADCGGFGLAAIHIEAAITALSGSAASAEKRQRPRALQRFPRHGQT